MILIVFVLPAGFAFSSSASAAQPLVLLPALLPVTCLAFASVAAVSPLVLARDILRAYHLQAHFLQLLHYQIYCLLLLLNLILLFYDQFTLLLDAVVQSLLLANEVPLASIAL